MGYMESRYQAFCDFRKKIFLTYLAKAPFKRGLGESAITKLLRYHAKVRQRKFVIFRKMQKSRGQKQLENGGI